jgi:hypothetical protein
MFVALKPPPGSVLDDEDRDPLVFDFTDATSNAGSVAGVWPWTADRLLVRSSKIPTQTFKWP